MPNALRIILALLAGAIVAILVVAGVEYAGHATAQPDAAWVVAAFAPGFGALVGGVLAILLARWRYAGWVLAVILAALAAINLMSFAHPQWFAPVVGIALVIGGWLATRIGLRTSAPR